MSNQTSRILSGIVLVFLVLLCLYIGQKFSLSVLSILGILVVDEIITNFYHQKRLSSRYLISQFTFIGLYLFLSFYQHSTEINFMGSIVPGLVLDSLLVIYLFAVKQKSERVMLAFKATSWVAGLYVLIPFLSLGFIVKQNLWRELFGGLLILNFTVDTAAYFTGKNFGKHKLWEAVSPKKTIEGFIGGVFFSVLFSSFYWHHFIAEIAPFHIIFFTILACCSQVGDLCQSKLKRQFEIKDSSSLIPGHGGVYDRLDSLFFVAPLYALFVYFM